MPNAAAVNGYSDDSRAAAVILFIASLSFMTELDVPYGKAAIDIEKGVIVRPVQDDPDGELLSVEFIGRRDPIVIPAFKYVETLFLRYARDMAITNPEGGDAKAQFEHISQHFQFKTGFGE